MNYLFLAILLTSSIFTVYPFSLPTFTLKKECESVTQADMSVSCPYLHNAHAYLKNKQVDGNPNCDITIICEHYTGYRLDKYVNIQILP